MQVSRASQRFLAELLPTGVSAFEVIPGGQSGDVSSPHYADLQDRWVARETQPMCGEAPWRVLTLTPA